MIISSIFDEDVPPDARDHFERGWAAATKDDYRTAYTHFALALKAAPKGRSYREVIVLADICGLESGHFAKWKDRKRAITEAANYAATFRDWYLVSATLASDVAVIKGAPREARRQLWRDAHRHSEASYGIAQIVTEVGASNLRQHRLHFEKLLRGSLTQLNQALQDSIGGTDPETAPHEAMSQVEDLLGQMATINAAKREALDLCATLLAAPEECWVDGSSGSQTEAIDHKRNVEVKAEQIRTQKSSGCCLYGLFYVLAMALPVMAVRSAVGGGHQMLATLRAMVP